MSVWPELKQFSAIPALMLQHSASPPAGVVGRACKTLVAELVGFNSAALCRVVKIGRGGKFLHDQAADHITFDIDCRTHGVENTVDWEQDGDSFGR